MNIGAGERLAALGPPGFGKTTLLQHILATGNGGRYIPSAVVFDSKQDPHEWAAWAPRHGYFVTKDPEDIRRYPRVVLLVDQRWLEDRSGWSRPGRPGYQWTIALRNTLHRGNTVAVFDEVLQTLPASPAHPEARRILTQGRSRNVVAIMGTQLANTMDTYILRVSEWCVCFSAIPDTVARLERARGVPSNLLLGLPKHHWAAHKQGTPSWEVHSPVPFRRAAIRRAVPLHDAAAPGANSTARIPQDLTGARTPVIPQGSRPGRPG